ncbi:MULTISPECIES: cysteine hydrolase family protein [unclassified Arthrobacter]|uniref:cysteine hydrolase family protein n=1 Tax=unclassified Arthrobacter TaxID=235627 RepID=UPI001D153857|nr:MULTISPECIES: isochorismatase family cysteine hydrolase [unclassified Arthrobacter]MCC3275653.1 cysteine hydrolase [Arthrobacter sp. zg-Y20]MCC3278731.1 cysteine hydrolase [Arthrobacter sp. zg-Y40]MCC9177093.1 cysteine hydrolase [Arthrobacter sp. zg-Y750]MDK1315810.1 isochorismatase family cysteine hydrolase [Arthrobacter sp. zg.Y20]MDK1326195.1 isochorismatase family cysteine hydrolase [Arthrobacter sp. zg-Y1143]
MSAALMVIDMQNAYFESPALQKHQERVVEKTNELIGLAKAAGVPVLMVCTEHERDKSTWTLSMLDDDQGFIFSGSEQADFVPGLDHADLPRLVKTRDSAFVGTDVLLRLRNWDVQTLVLAGVATHNCVAQTAADAFANNFRVRFAREALASTNEEYEEAILRMLSDEYRQPVQSNADLKDFFNSNES